MRQSVPTRVSRSNRSVFRDYNHLGLDPAGIDELTGLHSESDTIILVQKGGLRPSLIDNTYGVNAASSD